MPEAFWLGTTSDPSDPNNWYPNPPKADDLVHFYGNVMDLTGARLDTTRFHIGSDGTPITLQQTDPILVLRGGSELNMTVETPSNKGSHVRIDAYDNNTINMVAQSDRFTPTKATIEVNVGDNSQLSGSLNIGATKFAMHALGPNATFQELGDSYLTYANQDIIKIEPNMLGHGTWHMAYSNLELGGSVSQGQTFELNVGNSLTIDHADAFHGMLEFNGGNVSTVTLKDFFAKDIHFAGDQFVATSVDGRQAQFTINQLDAAHGHVNVANLPSGVILWNSPNQPM